ncbi:MBL fold metallo-hydrolase [Coleofasciculus chthonoplastes]|uniref:MBL fold metallo-hydrolase n=1 Tax=Coleofasciculus chthonoplastes TaxID=64178 RepID=UPI0032FD4D12
MEIHMIGHASIFVKTKDCRILMDPVLWDPFYGGTNEVCPKREVIHEQIPEFDFLVISHKHLDHFDIRSLAYLPKTVDVLIPRDKLIENYLRQLGYSQIYTLKDFNEVKIGSTTLLATRSENRVPEYGMVFADESGVFWNQVDTVLSPKTIKFVLSRYPQIDFLLATWQPMLEGCYQFNKSISFPYAIYNQLLYNISLIQPKAIAPGANGFKHVNCSSWLNQIVFPVTREQFCQDVKSVCPEIGQNVFPLDPGDILTFTDSKFCHLPKMCEYVRQVADNRESLAFSPVKFDTELKDNNPQDYDVDFLKKEIEEEIGLKLPKFITENWGSLFIEHRKWKVIYQLEVTFPDGSQQWVFDFSDKNLQSYKGYNPLANFFTYITASGFYGLLNGTLSQEYMQGGYYRRYHKVYSVTSVGITYPTSTELIEEVLEDPLSFIFSANQQNIYSEKALDLEIEKWSIPNRDGSESIKRKNPMIKIGDVLLKPTQELSLSWGFLKN